MQTQQNKLLFPLFLLVVILAAIFYIPGLNEEYQATKDMIPPKQQELTDKQAQHKKLADELKAFESLTNDQQKAVLDKIYTDLLQEEILTSLDTIKKSTGTEVATLGFTKGTMPEQAGIKEIQLGVEIAGSKLDQITQFLEQIEGNKRLYKVKGMNITSDKDIVKANITLSAFHTR